MYRALNKLCVSDGALDKNETDRRDLVKRIQVLWDSVCRVLSKAKAPDMFNKTWCVCPYCNWNDGSVCGAFLFLLRNALRVRLMCLVNCDSCFLVSVQESSG